jgi:hypothetical protein
MRSDQSRTHRLRQLIPLARAAALVSLLTVFLTWPQAGRAGSRIGDHRDPWFSAWRLAWIAHALQTDPGHLYDANIYFPELNTFAFSDAVLLQGVLGAPLMWAGWSPVLVYNDRLYQLKARYVIVHEQLFPRGAGADVLAATRGQAGLVSHGVYRDWAAPQRSSSL